MSSQLVANHTDDVEVYHGDEICRQKSRQLLREISLPEGLLPLENFVEVGYNRTTGFAWLKQKNKKEHKFRLISRNVMYDTEVTAFVEERRLKRLTGVKAKELMVWLSISDIYIDNPSSGKITFSGPVGITRSFPTLAFDLEEENNGEKK